MPKIRLTTPRMRMVQGDLDEAQTKDAAGNLRVVKSGPNAGQPNPQFFVAGAIPKTSPEWPAFWAALVEQAVAEFAALFPHGAAPVIAAGPSGFRSAPLAPVPGSPDPAPKPLCLNPNFSFKIADGDGFDDNGKSNATKEGFAGNWVVRFNSAYAPRCFHAGHYAPQEQIQEKGVIKRGYFIRVSAGIEGNANVQRPGMYINLDMVELVEPGPVIVTGPDAHAAFAPPGTPPPAAGAFAPPIAAAPPPPPVTAAPPPPAPTGPTMTAKAAGQTYEALIAAGWTDALLLEHGMVEAGPAPYEGFMPPPAPPAPVASPPPVAATPPPSPTAAPSSPTMTAKAAGATYESMVAAGWTDAALREHGYIV